MSTINTRVTKVIDIPTVGDNSIIGSIYQEHGQPVLDNMQIFLWVILCPHESKDETAAQARYLGITYIIADRDTAVNNI